MLSKAKTQRGANAEVQRSYAETQREQRRREGANAEVRREQRRRENSVFSVRFLCFLCFLLNRWMGARV